MQTIAYVKSVVDGDTFNTADGRIIRLANVDTPERGRYGYEAAKNHLIRLISGQMVIIQQKAIGHYGRIIADVWRQRDHLHINTEMKKFDKSRVLLRM